MDHWVQNLVKFELKKSNMFVLENPRANISIMPVISTCWPSGLVDTNNVQALKKKPPLIMSDFRFYELGYDSLNLNPSPHSATF